jgi:hypothetical protein
MLTGGCRLSADELGVAQGGLVRDGACAALSGSERPYLYSGDGCPLSPQEHSVMCGTGLSALTRDELHVARHFTNSILSLTGLEKG